MTAIPVAAMIRLFACLLLAGGLALLPLFRFNWRRLIRSSLFIKTIMWVPIFAGFVGVLYMPWYGRLVAAAAIDLLAYRELRRQAPKKANRQPAGFFYAGFVICSLHLSLLARFFDSQQAINFLITVCFASALSDVAAFFCGSYLGRHKLPTRLNNRKSWEGVAGQLLGALLGVELLKLSGIAGIFWLWLPIGLGTLSGDLANSFIKRRIGIKDWGNSLPGHGGYLDRFSSLFAGLVAACYALVWLG